MILVYSEFRLKLFHCIFVYHIFVRNMYLFASIIKEEVPDPYQCPEQIIGYFALRR